MAKKTEETPELQNEFENGEGTKEKAAEAVVVTGSKKVKIHTTEEIDCIVAQVPYKSAKGKDMVVPSDVASILVNSNKAYRI